MPSPVFISYILSLCHSDIVLQQTLFNLNIQASLQLVLNTFTNLKYLLYDVHKETMVPRQTCGSEHIYTGH